MTTQQQEELLARLSDSQRKAFHRMTHIMLTNMLREGNDAYPVMVVLHSINLNGDKFCSIPISSDPKRAANIMMATKALLNSFDGSGLQKCDLI